MVGIDCFHARRKAPDRRTYAKWMTLPELSGNMSQLYCESIPASIWISMMAKLAGATTVASN
jgi:hypothetical protein